MIREGLIVLFRFPLSDLSAGKLRPALVLRRCPGPHDDWLICMISTQLHQEVTGMDEVIRQTDPDFTGSGLKVASVVRITRIAIISSDSLCGAIGKLPGKRLDIIRKRIAMWIYD